MDNELEVIRDQMEEKRASLSDKLDALEDHVRETVHDATSVVTNTVRDVSETVDKVTENIQEAVQSVKETLNVGEQIRRNPWIAVGGAFAGGFIGAMLLGSSSRKRDFSRQAPGPKAMNGSAFELGQSPIKTPQKSDTPSGLTSQLGSAAAEALKTLEGMAVGTLMGALSQVVGDLVPTALKEDAEKLFSELNTHLGGKALYKLELPGEQANPTEPSKGDQDDNRDQAEMARTMGSAQREGQELVGQFDRRRTDGSPGGLRENDRSARGANGKRT